MEAHGRSSNDSFGMDSTSIRCPECGAHLREASYAAGAFTVLLCGPCGYTFRLDAHTPSHTMPSLRHSDRAPDRSPDEEWSGPERVVRLPVLEFGSPADPDNLPVGIGIELHVRVL